MKLFQIIKIGLVSLIFLATSPGVAKIYHEHTSTVASYDDYVFAYKMIGGDLSQMTLAIISKGPSSSIGDIFGHDITAEIKKEMGVPIAPNADIKAQMASDEALDKLIKPLTFREIATKIGAILKSKGLGDISADEVMRSFFEYTPLNDKMRNDRSYMSMGWDFRLYAQDFLMDQPQGAKYLFRNYLKRTPLEHRTIVSITANASQEFFRPENAKVMEEIRQEFAAAGSKLEWIGGITRASLQKEETDPTKPHKAFLEVMEKFKVLLQQGLVSGIDITGSIVEGIQKYLDLKESVESVLYERFQIMMDTLSDPKGPGQLKLHMYETSPFGEFYEIFFAALKGQIEKKGVAGIPPIIRIGHVSALRFQDIRRFDEFPQIKDRFVFEANLDSNLNMKNATAEKIAEIINELVSRGYQVRLGTDGIGIFGDVAYFGSTMARLKAAGLSAQAIEHITSQSDDYVYKNENYNRHGQHLQCKRFYQ